MWSIAGTGAVDGLVEVIGEVAEGDRGPDPERRRVELA